VEKSHSGIDNLIIKYTSRNCFANEKCKTVQAKHESHAANFALRKRIEIVPSFFYRNNLQFEKMLSCKQVYILSCRPARRQKPLILHCIHTVFVVNENKQESLEH